MERACSDALSFLPWAASVGAPVCRRKVPKDVTVRSNATFSQLSEVLLGFKTVNVSKTGVFRRLRSKPSLCLKLTFSMFSIDFGVGGIGFWCSDGFELAF